MRKASIIVLILASVGCQKYTCKCEVSNTQGIVVDGQLYEMTKTSYGRAENDCMRKGEKLQQKCYILIK